MNGDPADAVPEGLAQPGRGRSDSPRAALAACYGEIERLTKRMLAAIEADDLVALDRLADERGARLAEATELISRAGPGAKAPDSTGAHAPDDSPDQVDLAVIEGAARRAGVLDDRLRALAAARANEIPATLAAMRGGRSVLEGYSRTPNPPDSVDRRG